MIEGHANEGCDEERDRRATESYAVELRKEVVVVEDWLARSNDQWGWGTEAEAKAKARTHNSCWWRAGGHEGQER